MDNKVITVKRTLDVGLCLDILTNKHIFDSISEDGFDVEHLKVDVINNYWLGIYEKNEVIGVLLLKQIFSECHEIHIHILKEHRKYAKRAGVAIIEWCSQNIPNNTLYTNIPVIYKNVKYFVLSLGFKEAGLIPKVWKKNGEMNDMYIFTRTV